MFAALYLPDFSLQAALRHFPELWAEPVALIPEKGAKARIWHCTEPALAAGVAPGMTPSQGQARCGALQIRLRSEAAEECARRALLDGAGASSPYLEDTGPGICTLEIKGEERLPAWDEWAETLLRRLERLGLRARLGLAATPGLALLAAQSTPRWRHVRAATELHDLPLEALEMPAAMRDLLRLWGVREISALVRLGREALAQRLGPEALPFFDRAQGAVARPLRCLAPVESYAEAVEFEQEVETLEPLLFMLRRLLEQITWRLESTYLVAARLSLRLGLAQGQEYLRTFKIPAPTARVEVLFRTLHTHLERYTAEQPIISLQLEATPCRPPRQQFSLFETALRDPNQFFETLARLIALLGNDRVGVPAVEEGYRPDAFRLGEVEVETASAAPTRRGRAHPAAEPPPQPALGRRTLTTLSLRRFRPPLPAEVQLDAQQQPVAISCAALRGSAVAVQGPLKLSGEWWDERLWKRVEWELELGDGTLCRVYQQPRKGWFLEGVYD